VFNRTIGDSGFELEFAAFMERCDDVAAYAKNYLAVQFKLDYVQANGELSNYFPDFLVKLVDGRIIIAETKGQEDMDVAPKIKRLRQWCEDVNRVATGRMYDFVFVDQVAFEKYKPRTFTDVLAAFTRFEG